MSAAAGASAYASRHDARSEHMPVGNPCVLCRKPALAHRVEHKFQGHAQRKCERCALPLANHRLERKADTRERVRVYQRRERQKLILGIDGEGKGRDRHRYVFLAAADEWGEKKFSVSNPNGLSTEECLFFLYQLPPRARLFAYSFGYDLTKIFQSMTETHEGRRALWYLMRPEKRQRMGPEAAKGPYPVLWKGWSLNLQGTKFSFGRTGPRSGAPRRNRILWDIWKFYQSKFTTALEDWKIGTPEERALIARMKEKRHEFDKLSPAEYEQYCFLECQKMAEQARTLIAAHDEAGLPLKTFYGAGSTATVMLKKMGVRRHIAPAPELMREAVAQAFSGGRFEVGEIGCIRGAVHSYDISSAYPYQLCQLPCLIHGKWEHITKRSQLEQARWALVHYSLSAQRTAAQNHGKSGQKRQPQPGGAAAWGAFPFRFGKGHAEAGSICYPSESGGGWVYLSEYLAGEKYFDNVGFREAWVYRAACECMPFQPIPNYYAERCRIGKEACGICLKLGCNSCYGKVAQSVGKGQFNCWVWAGMITSGCRAQGLELLGMHSDRRNLLMFATDGILTREKLTPPRPLETGTFHVSECEEHKKTCDICPKESQTFKPLGGWEHKVEKRGVFLARPGVYFPLDPTEEDLRALRGRGIGRRVVLDNWERIIECWERRKKGTWPTLALDNVSRFCGAKTSTTRVRRNGEWVYRVAHGNHLKGLKLDPKTGSYVPDPAQRIKVAGKWVQPNPEPRYGEWVERKVEMSFDPMPKRIGRPDGTLEVRCLPTDLESAPYDRAVLSAEAKELIQMAEMLAEQPSGDFLDYDSE